MEDKVRYSTSAAAVIRAVSVEAQLIVAGYVEVLDGAQIQDTP